MKAISNYDGIKASNGGGTGIIEPGAYVCRIYGMYDHTDEAKPYLELAYDVYDQESKSMRFTDDLDDPERRWRHCFKLYLTSDFGWQRYKALVEAVEGTEENKGFRYVNADGAEQTLVGKWVGLVIRHQVYTAKRGKHKGEARRAPDLAGAITCANAIAGVFPPEWLEERDTRTDAERSAQASSSSPAPVAAPPAPAPDIADEDIPF